MLQHELKHPPQCLILRTEHCCSKRLQADHSADLPHGQHEVSLSRCLLPSGSSTPACCPYGTYGQETSHMQFFPAYQHSQLAAESYPQRVSTTCTGCPSRRHAHPKESRTYMKKCSLVSPRSTATKHPQATQHTTTHWLCLRHAPRQMHGLSSERVHANCHQTGCWSVCWDSEVMPQRPAARSCGPPTAGVCAAACRSESGPLAAPVQRSHPRGSPEASHATASTW